MKKYLEKGLLIFGSLLLCLCLFFGGVSFGYGLGLNDFWNPETPGEEITIEQAVQYLEKATKGHLYYLNHPKELNEMRLFTPKATIEFHQGCVDRYHAIINLLNSMK